MQSRYIVATISFDRSPDRKRRMMEQIELQVATRETLGKKVRFLRRQGITPVHLFGHNVESLALQCDTAQLQQVLAQAGRTRLVSIQIDKGKEPRSVLIREIQREPQTGELLHIDFYQVKTTEKTRVDVPVVLLGEAPALKLKENMLEQELNSLTVECFPTDIPASIEVDVSSLTEVGQAIRVKDIALGEKVTVLNEPELPLAKIGFRLIKEEVAVEEKEIEAEAAEAAEGAPPPEGKAEEPKKE